MTKPDEHWKVYPDIYENLDDLDARWLALERCPPWRRPAKTWSDREDKVESAAWRFDSGDEGALRDRHRAESYVGSGEREENQVNLALLLRRPLLVRGIPGIGKSSLAYHVSFKLGLGRPFRWEIQSTTSLQDGLYTYDAVGHFHRGQASPLEDHIRLGPLGTVLAPTERPTCLLVDELDKASYDLPNDLLHVLEEGAFQIPELEQEAMAYIRTRDSRRVSVRKGEIRCHHHPVVIITTNAEREFPPAFMRRCVELVLEAPTKDQIRRIVAKWFGGELGLDAVLTKFQGRSTDRVLQALYLSAGKGVPLGLIEEGLKEEKNS